MKIEERKGCLNTSIIGIGDTTYEVIRELGGSGTKEGEEVIVIQVYPTLSTKDTYKLDSTTMHLLNKMPELGWKKVHMVNLFSKVEKGKILAGKLKSVDKDNFEYIKALVKRIPECKFFVCWGNSLTTNEATNKTKKQILEYFIKNYPDKKLYHIVVDSMYEEMRGTHILFLGLRYSTDSWNVEEFPTKEEYERIRMQLKERENKNEIEKGKKSTDVCKNRKHDGHKTDGENDTSESDK